jgi:hypothetical protein
MEKNSFMVHQIHFFRCYKLIILIKFQNFISREDFYQPNDEYFKTDAINPHATIHNPGKKLPINASYRFLGRFLEVVSLNDSDKGSGQRTQRKKTWEHGT